MKRCTTSLIIREMAIKTTTRYHLTQVTLNIRKSTMKAGVDVEKREPSHTVCGNANCYSTMENSMEVPFCCSVAQLCPTLCNPMDCSRPGYPVLHHLPDFAQIFMSIESVMPSNHLILCHPFLFLPSIFPSIRVFSNESVLHIRWTKHWSISFSISSCNEYSGLVSFRIEWLDLLAVHGTLKSILQQHSSKASILQCSAFFMIQLTSTHDYWKNHSFD